MIIDIIVLIMLVMAVIKGLRRGLIIAVFSILAFIAGIAAAMKLSVVVAGYLKDSVHVSAKWLPVLSFLLVFVGVVLLVRLVASILEKSIEMVLLGWVNKIGGIILYIVLYLFMLSVLLFFAQQVKLFSESTLQQSVTWSWIQPLGPWVINGFGKLIPVFKDMFTELSNFFAGLAHSEAS